MDPLVSTISSSELGASSAPAVWPTHASKLARPSADPPARPSASSAPSKSPPFSGDASAAEGLLSRVDEQARHVASVPPTNTSGASPYAATPDNVLARHVRASNVRRPSTQDL